MRKGLLIIILFFIASGFTFPKDIGLIDMTNVEITKSNLASYLSIPNNFKYSESKYGDGSKAFFYTSENVSISMQQDNKTIEQITFSNIDISTAEQIIKDFGIGVTNQIKEVLNNSGDSTGVFIITEHMGIAIKNNSDYPNLLDDTTKPIIINIIYTDERVEAFLEIEYGWKRN